MRFVNCSDNRKAANLTAFQHNSKIYYWTCKEIPAGDELLVWYGDTYAQELGLLPKESIKTTGTAKMCFRASSVGVHRVAVAQGIFSTMNETSRCEWFSVFVIVFEGIINSKYLCGWLQWNKSMLFLCQKMNTGTKTVNFILIRVWQPWCSVDTKETWNIGFVYMWSQTIPKRRTDNYRDLKFLEMCIVTND